MYQQFRVLLVLSSLSLFQVALPRADSSGGQASWTPIEDSWNYWWSYSGVSGPTYWGLLNLDWFMCDKGRRQSPIDIETRSLVYDPHLTPLRADNNLISGFLYNDGHAIVFNCSIPITLMSTGTQSSSNSELTNNRQLNSSSVSKRHTIPGIDEVFSQTSDSKLDSPSSSAAILRDLSNSVELSISQNDRLESSHTDGDGGGVEKSVADDNKLNGGDTGDGIDLSDGSMAGGNELQNQSVDGDSTSLKVQFTGGGLSYPYKFETLYLRFSLDTKSGSEHLINSHAYAAELQLLAYNSLLYKSFAEASVRSHGLLAISVLVDVLPHQNHQSGTSSNNSTSKTLNEPLESLLGRLSEVRHRGSSTLVRGFNLSALLPETDYFVTYEGSLTMPGCHESVNWLVLNKPLYITQSNLDSLRSISADEQSITPTGTLIAGNIRPAQPVNNRQIRTNIRPTSSNENPETCQRLWTKYEYKQTRVTSDPMSS